MVTVRAAQRHFDSPDYYNRHIGFRLVRTVRTE